MIEIKVKIHDKFSVEFKIAFVVDEERAKNDFAINSWIFIPNSLDINSRTYSKEQFYRDVKSYIRLKTPVFSLCDIANGKAIPKIKLENALKNIVDDPSEENIADYEYHIKMFTSIVKSAMRNESVRIINLSSEELVVPLCDAFCDDVTSVLRTFRDMRKIITESSLGLELLDYYNFGDEFISRLAEQYSFHVLKKIDSMPSSRHLNEVRSKIVALIKSEVEYKKEVGYSIITKEDSDANRDIVYRHSILKKYTGSELYIKLDKKSDGRAAQQVSYAIAAGISMIFATIIAFTAQQRYGSYSFPLFFSLVVGYIFKDRIKDLGRYYFAHKLGAKYFDNKAIINIKDKSVGWIKEGADFITDDKTPSEVLGMRNRTALLEAGNRIFDEKILLYRKLVFVNGEELKKQSEYNLSGIHDIIRLHIKSFINKMDDPVIPLRLLGRDDKIDLVYTDKVYYINVIMQFNFNDKVEYKRFRLVATRNGILEVQDVSV